MDRSDSTLAEIVALRACGRHTWKEVAEYTGLTWQSARSHWRRRGGNVAPGPCPVCGQGEEEPGTTADGEPALGEKPEHSWSEEGNYAEAEAFGPRIRTVEQLLEACAVDEGKWDVVESRFKYWELGAKIRYSDLTYEDGKASGWLRDEGLGVTDLWSVYAKCLRKEPVALKPLVQPVECPVTYEVPEPPETQGDVLRGMLVADPQFGYARDIQNGHLDPFHDRQALDIVLQVAVLEQPDHIAILGDLLDLTMWTDRFARSIGFYFTTQPAVLEAHWWLRRLREACPEAQIDVLEGNHDVRMRKALEAHLIEACELKAADEMHLPPAMSPEKLLALHQLGIGWVGDYPIGEAWMGPLRLQHGDIARKPPGATARAVAEETDVHTAFGHVHRKESVTRRVRTREGWRTVRTYCPGCVCRIDGAVPGSNPKASWCQGLGLVDYTQDEFVIYDVGIEAGRALWDRRAIEGRDVVPDLARDLPDWHW